MTNMSINILLNKNNITRILFVIACLVIIVTFITSTTYTQLAIAVLFYPPLIYFAFKLFPRNSQNNQKTQVQPGKPAIAFQPDSKTERGSVDIVDIDKRAFLKIIGAAGLSFFLYSLFLKRTEDMLFGRTTESGTVALQDSAGQTIHPAETQPTDGYRISEIDESEPSYYGFTNVGGAWYIMKEDNNSGSFRYAKGIADFSNNWEHRNRHEYDYFHNVFP